MNLVLNENLLAIILAASAVAIPASLLGTFIIVKRMALVGDVLSHVALPGLGLGLLFGFDPIFGALAFLVFAAFGTWILERKTFLPAESIIGVFFTAALAVGVLVTPKEDLLESLFGNLSTITRGEISALILISLLIFIFTVLISKRLLLATISEDLARVNGFKPDIIYLIFLLLFSFIVALGIKFVGTLLMGALAILPASISRNFALSFKSFKLWSVFIGLFMVVSGIVISNLFNSPPGPAIILVGIAIFIISLFFNKLTR